MKKYSFQKHISKLYITFEFLNWEHLVPYGQITQVIGPVNELNNFYEYLASIQKSKLFNTKITKDTIRKIKNRTNDEIIRKLLKNIILFYRNKNEYYVFP